jgi:hypothetical protein
VYPTAVLAWGFEGHRVVGSIADELLRVKPNAQQQVQKILNDSDFDSHDLDLRKAGPWADCVRSVAKHDDGRFHYEVDPDHLEFEVPCTPFNSSRERARIVDYAALTEISREPTTTIWWRPWVPPSPQTWSST